MTTNRRPPNPIGGMSMPPTGQRLPDDFYRRPAPRSPLGSIQMDQRNWDEVFASPQWSAKKPVCMNLVQQARLTGPNLEED